MFQVGSFRAALHGAVTRRAFLTPAASAPLALGMPNAPAGPRGRARSVIFLWLWGAPSHLDTFDPKPAAPAEVKGPFSAIATRTPGLLFTELLPRLADRSHLFSVVRSHVTFNSGHPDAGTWGLTGFADRPE